MAEEVVAETVWGSLTPVERTSLQTTFHRQYFLKQFSEKHSGSALYTDPFGQLILQRCVPPEEQARMAARHEKDQPDEDLDFNSTMGVRTAEIDQQLHLAVQDSIKQVVLLGAGWDTRAWRLDLGEGVTVIEVDSSSIVSTKQRVLRDCPPRSKRLTVQADIGDAAELMRRLHVAGYDDTARTVWVLEGLIGYLQSTQIDQLFKAMYQSSAVGSAVVATAPPTPATRDRRLASGRDPLLHTTFETPDATAARFSRAGWQVEVVDSQQLIARYKLRVRLDILLARKQQ